MFNSRAKPEVVSRPSTTKTTITSTTTQRMPDHLIAIASQANFSIQIWHLRPYRYVHSLNGHIGYVRSLTLVKPDLLASASEDRTIRLAQRWPKCEDAQRSQRQHKHHRGHLAQRARQRIGRQDHPLLGLDQWRLFAHSRWPLGPY